MTDQKDRLITYKEGIFFKGRAEKALVDLFNELGVGEYQKTLDAKDAGGRHKRTGLYSAKMTDEQYKTVRENGFGAIEFKTTTLDLDSVVTR